MFVMPNESGEMILYMQLHEFGSLSEDLRKMIESCTSIKLSEGEYIQFEIHNVEKVYEIIEKAGTRNKNKIRSENRKSSMYILSSGITEKSDIEKIYEAQQGLCYYSRTPLKNEYEIDHIIPISECGSSWPNNIALTTKLHNRNKKTLSKNKYLALLGKNKGKEWLSGQKQFIKEVDKIRKLIDKSRRKEVERKIEEIQTKLQNEFPEISIEYSLFIDTVELEVDNHKIEFPAGFIRTKSKFNSYAYMQKIVHAIIGT